MMINQKEIQTILQRVCHEGFGDRRAVGNDSTVAQVGELFFHKYNGESLIFFTSGRVLPKISLYAEIANRAVMLSTEEEWLVEIKELGLDYALRVNPVLAVVLCERCDEVFSIAPTVFATPLNETTLYQQNEDVVENALKVKSAWLRKKLNCEGINLRPENIMTDHDGWTIVDLAAIVGIIKQCIRV